MKFDLFEIIASSLNIRRGKTESLSLWHTRIAYSVAGRIALSSLWDSTDDDISDGISINHFKQKIIHELNAFCEIDEEIKYISDNEDFVKDIADEIYDIYLRAGCFYHKSYVIYPITEHVFTYNQITFIRGSALQESVYISGLGFYNFSQINKNNYIRAESVYEMFNISPLNLDQIWQKIISRYEPQIPMSLDNVEYLSLSPYFSSYWSDDFKRTKNTSLLREKKSGDKNYYLYRNTDDGCLYRKLPNGLVHDKEYLQIANCILNESNNLPPAKYKEDGDIIYLSICYLYPPSILNFIKLYSWPWEKVSNDFERVITKEIFEFIQSVLTSLGYSFTKQKE